MNLKLLSSDTVFGLYTYVVIIKTTEARQTREAVQCKIEIRVYYKPPPPMHKVNDHFLHIVKYGPEFNTNI